MFGTAKTLETPKTGKSAPKAPEVAIPKLKTLAALDACIKTMSAMKALVETSVKAFMLNYFIAEGLRTKSRPVNIRGIDGAASASCELKAKASNIALTEEELELCKVDGVKTKVVTFVHETYVINPIWANDLEVLSAVEAALKKKKGIPEDLFMKQEGVTKTVLDDNAITDLFATGDEARIRRLLPMMTTLAVKPTQDADDTLESNLTKVVALLDASKKEDVAATSAKKVSA